MNLKFIVGLVLIFSCISLISTHKTKKKHSDKNLSRIYKNYYNITIKQEIPDNDDRNPITSVDTLNDKETLIPSKKSLLKRKAYDSFTKQKPIEYEQEPRCDILFGWILNCLCCSS